MKSKKLERTLGLTLMALSIAACATTEETRFTDVQGFNSPIREGSVIYIERELPFPIDVVWEKVFRDFGGVAKFNPNFVGSGYLTGDTLAVGTERYCHSKEDGSAGVHERVVYLNEAEREVQFQIFKAIDVPIDTESTFGTSQLVEIDAERTLFRIRFVVNTSPGFLIWFAKGDIRDQMDDMMIGMEHYLRTGEAVTKDNFDRIKSAVAQKR